MNKTELVKELSVKIGETQKRSKEILDALQEIVFAEMAKESEVKLFDGVTLMGVHKDATTARNPMDGSTVNVPAKTAPKAKFGAPVKAAINA